MADMKISPNYFVSDWKKLDLSDPTKVDENWEKAFEIFDDRFTGRYFDIIKSFQHNLYSGFIVMAIDCMLIETLEQFYQGKRDSNRKSREFFIKCLKQREPFTKLIDKKYVEIFYDHFRNGIVHQAESKEESKVRIYGSLIKPVDKSDIDKGFIVNRIEFNAAVEKAYSTYIGIMKDTTPLAQDLRPKFKAKMDLICR